MWWWRASSARPDRRPSFAPEAGSLLLERLIALAISGAILVTTLSLWQQLQESYFRGSEAAQAQQDARAGLEVMVRDVRQASRIVAAESDRIVFQSALDPPPMPQRTFDLGAVAGCALRCIRYDRGDGAGLQPIADDIAVGGLIFAYRDATNTLLAAPVSAAERALIRRVDMTVRGQTSPASSDPPFTFSSTARLRNR